MKLVPAIAILCLAANAALGLAANAALAAPPPLANTPPPLPAGDPLSKEANAAFLAANGAKKGVITKADGLQFRILRNGFGRRPAPTDTVKVIYAGRLINGNMFDGTSPGLPAYFKVTDVIPGWVEALEQMREGDRWEIVIPSELGYGPRGSGTAIPPDQTLVFDVTLVQAIPAPKKGEPGYVPDRNDKDDQ